MDEPVAFAKRKLPVVEAILNELGFGWYQVRLIIILGVAHSTDTMESIIQAILGPSLRCTWQLSSDYVALLTTLVFLGSCIGAVPLGYAADVFGRRAMCLLSCITLIYLSLLCSITPTYSWIASLRFFSGIFIGGMLTSGSSLLSENMPENYQATGQLITYTFEALVGLVTAGFGLLCLKTGLNWRFFVFLTTAPLGMCAICLACYIKESPVFLYCKKKTIEAAEVLDEIAITNNKMPKIQAYEPSKEQYAFSFIGRLKQTDEAEEFRISKIGAREICFLLFKKKPWLLPLLLVLNFLWGFILYGGATILPVELASTPRLCLQDIGTANVTAFRPNDELPSTNVECCKPLQEEGYLSLLASASGGLVSFPVAYTLVHIFGRQWSVTISFILTGILLFIEAFCLPSIVINIGFFAIRAAASAGYGVTGIYASSVYQARVRSLTTGLCAMAFRMGILTAPYLGQVFLQKHSALLVILLFSLSCFIGAGLSVGLPKPRILKRVSEVVGGVTSGNGVGHQSVMKKTNPVFRSIFRHRQRMTAEEAAAMAIGEVVRQRKQRNPNASAHNPTLFPVSQTPSIALVTPTYSQLTNQIRPDDGLVHVDFVNRSAAFEVDA